MCYIYREKRATGFSIEEVFANVRSAMTNDVEQLEYTLDSTKSRIWNIIQIRKINADIYHITGDCNYIGIGLMGKKGLLTIHDLGHLLNTTKGIKKIIYRLFWWQFPLAVLSRFTAVSSFTKRTLEETFGKKISNKTDVIHNPLDRGFTRYPRNTLLQKPNILQIGSGLNKNIKSLIEAVTELEVKLILVRQPDNNLEKELIDKGIEYEWHIGVSKSDLLKLYQKSDIVYFASTYEGFGLPIIEAQASGRPVITSSVCSMPEVAGSINTLVDPLDYKQIRDKIIYLQSEENWNREVNIGIKNVSRFDATLIANQYYQTYLSMTNAR